MANDKLRGIARTSDYQIFSDSNCHKIFGNTPQNSYMEQNVADASMLQNMTQHYAMRKTPTSIAYRDMRKY